MNSVIKDPALWQAGKNKIDWVDRNMPILKELERDFKSQQYFAGVHILVCIHLEAKTARLIKLLRDGGASVVALGSNPLSTQDDVAAALAQEDRITVFAKYGCTETEYFEYIQIALDTMPRIIIDDGGDVVHEIHTNRPEMIDNILGGCEETTTGVLRLRSMENAGILRFPMMSVNDAFCKYLFDNRYGTGQSVWDGINRTTNLIISGKTVVIAGYGWCGKGCAMRAKGLGAKVVVCEIDPIKAMEAVMDGFTVLPMDRAAKVGEVFVTVTGCDDVIRKEHFAVMPNGALLANAGHFDVEINIPDLEQLAVSKEEIKQNITCYTMADGRHLNLLAQGRLVNLAAGDGHPAEIMDLSFAIQALCAKYILENSGGLENRVHIVPEYIDRQVAYIKLQAWDTDIDVLSEKQEQYLYQWHE